MSWRRLSLWFALGLSACSGGAEIAQCRADLDAARSAQRAALAQRLPLEEENAELKSHLAEAVVEAASSALAAGDRKRAEALASRWPAVAAVPAVHDVLERVAAAAAREAACAKPQRVTVADVVVEKEKYDGLCLSVAGWFYPPDALTTGQMDGVTLIGLDEMPVATKKRLLYGQIRLVATGVLGVGEDSTTLQVQRVSFGW